MIKMPLKSLPNISNNSSIHCLNWKHDFPQEEAVQEYVMSPFYPRSNTEKAVNFLMIWSLFHVKCDTLILLANQHVVKYPWVQIK